MRVLCVLLLVSCAAPPPPGEALRSSKSRVTQPPDLDTFNDVVRGNTDTALNLHRALAEGDANFFFSPLSIQLVLGMAAAGSAGDTAEQFARVLPLSNAADFHRSMNYLDAHLASRGAKSKGADGEPFALVRMNQLFIDDDQSIEPAYLDVLAQEYGAGVQRLPMRSDPSGATSKINTWVARRTKDHIPSLLAGDAINETSRLVLINAMYFSAGWDKAFTRDERVKFTPLTGEAMDVAMMAEGNIKGSEVETDDVELISIPYSGKELSLRIVMPKNDFRAFEAEVTGEQLTELFAQARGTTLDVTMPPFEIRARRDLKTSLRKLGLEAPFSEAADFSGMTGKRDLHIDFLFHEAWVQVSKTGTRAAAATVGGLQTTSAPPPPKRVVIDKPFLFFIVDDATSAVLFMGRYVRP